MANKTRKSERQRLLELARVVADVASLPKDSKYQPSIADPAIANAFDEGMRWIGRENRAWRGNAAVRP